MKIILLGSLGKINHIVAPALIADGHEVTIITRSKERLNAIEAIGAKGSVGNMQDAAFLTEQFQNNDVAYLMISTSQDPDLFSAAQQQAAIFAGAIKNSGIKKIVDLSSIGADAGPEAGSLYAYHLIENILRAIPNIDIAFVRPVGFYDNLYAHLETIKKENKIYSNVPGSILGRYVAPEDIAKIIVPLLENTPGGHTVHYAISDTFTLNDFALELSQQLDKKQAPIEVITISDEDYRQALLKNQIPTAIIDSFIQMNAYERQPEKIGADLERHHPVYGDVKLKDFISRYIAALNAPSAPKAKTIVSEKR